MKFLRNTPSQCALFILLVVSTGSCLRLKTKWESQMVTPEASPKKIPEPAFVTDNIKITLRDKIP